MVLSLCHFVLNNKMKKNILLPATFLLIILISCNQSIRFGITQKYYNDESEQEGAIIETVIDHYESVINKDDSEIPLNKLVESKDYKVYIGVSLTHNALELFNTITSDSLRTIYEYDEKDGAFNIFSKYADYYYNTYLYLSPKDKMTFVLNLESDSITVKNKYSGNFLHLKTTNE